jgi:hypothetical protein
MDAMIENIVMAKLSGGKVRERRDQASFTSEVIADRDTNSLIIAAPDFACKRFRFHNKIGRQFHSEYGNRTIVLKNADAREISQGLQQSPRRGARIFTAGNLRRIRSTPRGACLPEDVEAIVKVLNELDRTILRPNHPRLLLENADAMSSVRW